MPSLAFRNGRVLANFSMSSSEASMRRCCIILVAGILIPDASEVEKNCLNSSDPIHDIVLGQAQIKEHEYRVNWGKTTLTMGLGPVRPAAGRI